MTVDPIAKKIVDIDERLCSIEYELKNNLVKKSDLNEVINRLDWLIGEFKNLKVNDSIQFKKIEELDLRINTLENSI